MTSDSLQALPVTPSTTLATIALRSVSHAAVLDRHGLDFCCRGGRTLAEACVAMGVEPGSLLAEFDAEVRAREARNPSPDSEVDWDQRPLTELVGYIVQTRHAFTRAAMGRIAPLLAKVVAKHASRHPELETVASAFRELSGDMEPHMAREEGVLFPYITALEDCDRAPSVPPFGTVRNPVRMMMREHDRAGELLATIEQATGRFVPPADTCGSLKAAYAALADLRMDLLRHVSLENNVLFPRAIALESGLSGGLPGPTAVPPVG